MRALAAFTSSNDTACFVVLIEMVEKSARCTRDMQSDRRGECRSWNTPTRMWDGGECMWSHRFLRIPDI